MPLRLIFTLNDVARVRVQASLGPFAETLLAYSRIRSRETPRQSLHNGSRPVPTAISRDRSMARLLWLTPGVGLDLFTVVGRTRGPEDSRRALLDADPEHVAAESEYWAQLHQHARHLSVTPPLDPAAASLLSELRSGSTAARSALLDEVENYFRRTVEAHWHDSRNQLAAEQARLERHLANGGVEALLAAVGDQVRWNGSSLDLSRAGVLQSCRSELKLQGRGLTVVPSFYALEAQTYWPTNPAEPGLLITPMRKHPSAPSAPPTPFRSADSTVLGATRTSVLAAIARRPYSTSELAGAVGITISGASQHASRLRAAGLVATQRDGQRVLHTITDLGEQLIAYVHH